MTEEERELLIAVAEFLTYGPTNGYTTDLVPRRQAVRQALEKVKHQSPE